MSNNAPLRIGLQEYPMTLVIMAICISLFLLQLVMGVDPNQPSNEDLIKWGANFLPFTLGNDVWRMVTSLFLHIGLMHLMFNMFALYYFGQIAERMFGSINLLALFLLSGIGGNVLNNYLGWQGVTQGQLPVVSAGASGGIMGIGMALLITALLKTAINRLQLSFHSIFMVMAINLGYGFLVGGIDNAGHIGGAIVGALLGLLYVLQYRKLSQNNDPINIGRNTPISLVTPLTLGVYGGLLIGFSLIYWQLHMALVGLLASTAPHGVIGF